MCFPSEFTSYTFCVCAAGNKWDLAKRYSDFQAFEARVPNPTPLHPPLHRARSPSTSRVIPPRDKDTQVCSWRMYQTLNPRHTRMLMEHRWDKGQNVRPYSKHIQSRDLLVLSIKQASNR